MDRMFVSTIACVFAVLLPACSGPEKTADDSAKESLEWTAVKDWLKLPEGAETLGNAHGDLAVAKNGDVYLSITKGPYAGLQVYGPDGTFLRLVEGAPTDLHGFIIHENADGTEYIYGPRLTSGSILKLSLAGEVVLEIPANAIPEEHWKEHPRSGKKMLRLTDCAVADNGDIYVTDGYNSDLIHRFSSKGEYLATFGGKEAPYLFQTLHQISIDNRFDPPRIVGASRTDGRVLHLSLDGEFLGEVATGLKMPAALDLHGDLLAVGEMLGRVSLLDKEGTIVKQLGINEVEDEVGTNKTEPGKWRFGVVNAPHGIAFSKEGDIYVTEWSVYGRVVKFNRLE